MAIIGKLRDVEQQLLRTTQVVELHVQIADTSQDSQRLGADDETQLVELVDSVERVLSGLQTATTRLLSLAKQFLPSSTDLPDSDTETEDEAESLDEEPLITQADINGGPQRTKKATSISQQTIGAELTAAPSQRGATVSNDAEYLSGVWAKFDQYTSAAMAFKTGTNDNNGEDTDTEAIERMRTIVKGSALDATRVLLDHLNDGTVGKEAAATFAEATTVAVSLLTSRRPRSHKRTWLMQLIEDLSDILNAVEGTQLAKVLGSVEKSRDELVDYCSHNFRDALEDMTNYVILIERHRGVEASRLQPFMLVLLRKFICDCVDYRLRQDAGEDARSEAQWKQFAGVGTSLANWMDILSAAKIRYSKKNAQMIGDKLCSFDTRFPHRIPVALMKNWRLMPKDPDKTQQSSILAKDSSDSDAMAPSVETGVKRSRTEPLDECLASKRAAVCLNSLPQTTDSATILRNEMNTFLDWATRLSQNVRAGNESPKKAADDIRRLLSKVVEKSKQFENQCRHSIDEDTAIMFGLTTKIVVGLIYQYPCDSTARLQLRAFLRMCDAIRQASTTKTSLNQLVTSLTASKTRLEDYWSAYYADPFQAMQKHVEATEKKFKDLDPVQLEAPARQLVCQLRDACEVTWLELNQGASNSHRRQLQKDLRHFGRALSWWLERMMGRKSRLLDVDILSKLLVKVKRVETRLPDSASTSLMRNINRLICELEEKHHTTNKTRSK